MGPRLKASCYLQLIITKIDLMRFQISPQWEYIQIDRLYSPVPFRLRTSKHSHWHSLTCHVYAGAKLQQSRATCCRQNDLMTYPPSPTSAESHGSHGFSVLSQLLANLPKAPPCSGLRLFWSFRSDDDPVLFRGCKWFGFVVGWVFLEKEA